MATRSAIGYKTVTGEVNAIYCHWDGYLEHNGKILAENYTTEAKVRELIALGDLSGLGETIGSKTDFNNAAEGQCVAYGRDRGETDVAATTFEDTDEFVTRMSEQNCELFYLWNGNEWIVSNGTLQFDRVEDLILHPMFNL